MEHFQKHFCEKFSISSSETFINNVVIVVLYDHLPCIGQTFDALLPELWGLGINEGDNLGKKVIGVTEFYISDEVLEGTDKVIFGKCKVRTGDRA